MNWARNHAAVHVERFPKQLTLQPQIHPCTQTKEQVPVHTHTHTHKKSLPGLQRVWCWWGEPARGGPTEIPAGPMTHKQCAHTPPTEFCTTERKRERTNNNTHTAFIEQVHLWKHGKQMKTKEKTTRAPCLSALCCCFCLLLEIFL